MDEQAHVFLLPVLVFRDGREQGGLFQQQRNKFLPCLAGPVGQRGQLVAFFVADIEPEVAQVRQLTQIPICQFAVGDHERLGHGSLLG